MKRETSTGPWDIRQVRLSPEEMEGLTSYRATLGMELRPPFR